MNRKTFALIAFAVCVLIGVWLVPLNAEQADNSVSPFPKISTNDQPLIFETQ